MADTSNGRDPGEYRAIACELHDHFEIAIMRARPVRASILEDGRWCEQQILPLDLVTASSEELLLYRDSRGQHARVRLDRVRLLQPG